MLCLWVHDPQKSETCGRCGRRGHVMMACWRVTASAGSMLEAGTKVTVKASAVKSSPLVKMQVLVRMDVTMKEVTTKEEEPQSFRSRVAEKVARVAAESISKGPGLQK